MSVLAVAVLAVFCAVGRQTAAPAPDFSGHWVLIAPPELAALPGQEQRVKQDATTLTVSGPDPSGPSFTYRLDGTEHSFPGGGKTWAKWEGSKLRIVAVMGTSTSTNLWSLDEDGRLTIQSSVVDEPAISMTMVFKRKAEAREALVLLD